MKKILLFVCFLALLSGCGTLPVRPSYTILYSKDFGDMAHAKWEANHEAGIRCKLGYEYWIQTVSDEQGKKHWLLEIWCR